MTAPEQVTIDRCPVCGNALQATAKLYLSNVVMDDDGEFVSGDVDETLFADLNYHQDFDVTDVYCSEDHTVTEMLEAWDKNEEGS